MVEVQNFKYFNDRLNHEEQLTQLKEFLLERNSKGYLLINGIQSCGLALFINQTSPFAKCHHVVICPDKESAYYFHNDLESISNKKEYIFVLPECYQFGSNKVSINQSHQILSTESLLRVIDDRPTIWVTYPEALLEKFEEPHLLSDHAIRIKVNETIELEKLLSQLIDLGFSREDFVYEPGSFSLRGDILDIYSFGNENPYRIELFDNEVESIRIFDAETQLSLNKLIQINLIPDGKKNNLNWNSVRKHFFEMIPNDTLIWSFDLNNILLDIDNKYQSIPHEFEIKTDQNEIEVFGKSIFVEKNEVIDLLKNFNVLDVSFKKTYSTISDFWDKKEVINFKQKQQPSFNRNFKLFTEDLQSFRLLGYEIFLCAENVNQLSRIQKILEDVQSNVQFIPLNVSLSGGFIDEEKRLVMYTDHQIFQRFHKYKVKSAYNRNKAISLKTLQELVPGDFVVHIDHGIGTFSGLQRIEVNGGWQEAVRILYKDNDVLFVNVNSLHKISRFTGKEGTPPNLNKIGGSAWAKVKNKAKRRIKELAIDLINLYATRKNAIGFAFSPDTFMQNELEASFFYEDTPDQIKATNDVKADMEKDKPMDRLICGDVGFGKTEVAIRAAFKAVADSKQVAILVPTTILAYQHYKTFTNRLEEFPCNIEFINRFKTTKEKNEIIKKVEEGKVDILVGTHAILNDKINYKNLGLLIIDEEQKFGVGAKEKIRAIKNNVDTLTLSATPIPRTLQFSLMGARDMSVMATPPVNRQPVHTEILTFDVDQIKEAIDFELERNGQIYFVHNRIQSLDEIRNLISKMCPNANVVAAHGQMDGKVLENILMDYIEGVIDVLVSTNIVESGVDIPNANTIFINNAHMFGLSDLHQLRGRVGRSNIKAFCYLLAPPLSVLPNDSKKRLMTLEEFNELGSGFQIAMRDLDIRGAGDLLGADQSGFITDIGFDMYKKILNQTVIELKKTEFKSLFDNDNNLEFVQDCVIDTDLEILIPDTYVSNIQERLNLYTRLNNCESEPELETILNELEDRFGKLPLPVYSLSQIVRCRWLSIKLGFEKINFKNGKVIFYFIKDSESAYFQSELFQKMMIFVQNFVVHGQFKQLGSNFMLIVNRIENINELYQLLQKMNDQLVK